MLFQQLIEGMTTPEIIGQILGVIVTIACIVTAQLPKRWQILLGQIFTNILSATNMFLVGQGLTACLPCFVAAAHCGINVFRDRKGSTSPLWEKIVFSILYFIAWGIGFGLSCAAGTASVLDILPLIATALFVASVLVSREQLMRLCSLGNASTYVIYNAIFKNSAIFAHIFTIISLLIALFRYRKQGKPKKEAETEQQ